MEDHLLNQIKEVLCLSWSHKGVCHSFFDREPDFTITFFKGAKESASFSSVGYDG